MKLVELLQQAKKQGFLYCSTPYPCGLDEAIGYVKCNIPNDKGFKKNQLSVIEKDNQITYEIRKSQKHKKCFAFKVWS